jgi:hypothetical protein
MENQNTKMKVILDIKTISLIQQKSKEHNLKKSKEHNLNSVLWLTGC